MDLLRASAIRALRTAIQTGIALIGTATVLTDVNWITVLSGTALAALISFLQGVALGLPEAKGDE